MQEVQKVTGQAEEIRGLAELAQRVDEAVNRLGEVAMHLGKTALSPDIKAAFAYAKPFLDVMGDVCMAWMLLWRETIAVPRLEKLVWGLDPETRQAKAAKNKEAAFYEGQLQSARYFINSILPITMGKMNAIEAGDPAVVEIPESSFGV